MVPRILEVRLVQFSSYLEESSIAFYSERTRDYTETVLWDIWYTKNPQGISEVNILA